MAISQRLGYQQHGIYIGRDKVIHYAGFCDGWKAGKVEITSLDNFCQGKKTYVKTHPNRKFSRRAVVKRARSRLGEDTYCLFRNNCEHFVHWCVYDEHKSEQVEQATKILTSASTSPLLGGQSNCAITG